MSSGAAQANAPFPTIQVSQELDRCASARNSLRETISELEKRLQPILRPEPAPPQGREAKENKPRRLAEAVLESSTEIETCAAVIRSIIHRLEL